MINPVSGSKSHRFRFTNVNTDFIQLLPIVEVVKMYLKIFFFLILLFSQVQNKQ